MIRTGAIPIFLTLLLAGVAGPAQTNPGVPVPPLPTLKSPVDTFRELLALSPKERTQALADRPADARKRLLEKLAEYQALSADERAARLLATELRWWLLPLMRLPATNRTTELALVPAGLRKLIEDRLQVWDILPPELQRTQLENEDVAQWFTRLQGVTPEQRERMLNALTPERRKLLEAGLARWTAMSTDERRGTCQQFDRYFELTPREQGRVLSQLSETEREQMELTLQSFAKLPREQRAVCLRSFEKFASMSAVERQHFLKNAERWEKMSPAEREQWRRLVKSVPEFPPLPPNFMNLAPPLPPALPRAAQPPVTNGGG